MYGKDFVVLEVGGGKGDFFFVFCFFFLAMWASETVLTYAHVHNSSLVCTL